MIETPLRPRHDISDGWEFVRGRVSRRWLQGRKRGGEIVDLPHCWNRTDTFQVGRKSYTGHGAYRRELVVPEPVDADGRWRLCSEGFFGLGDIWLDGRCLTRFDGQYLGFGLDLPPAARAGQHVLAIRLNNVWRRDVLPGRRDPDFLLYGGLAGRMWLEWAPSIHIGTETVDIRCTSAADGSEDIELCYEVKGLESSHRDGSVSWKVTNEDGEEVALMDPSQAASGRSTTSVTIPKPRCWSPEDPHLHWAEGRLELADGTSDVVRVRFGVTRAEFRPNQGFYLDGERVDLHGCNRHESIPGLGNALPEELHRADAQLLKNFGCNFVRLSHYPQHPSFLDACDELGIMVYAEIASWKSVSSSRGWRRAARRQMRSMVLRDRHHPSVILWGMGNESRSRKVYLELQDIARSLDPSRPVTYAENHLYRARREKTVGIADVWGVNYELDVLEEARDASRLQTVIASECCNYPNSIKGDDGAEITQVATLEYEWKLMEDRPFLAGHAVWCFTDYATEHRKRYRRQPGLFDAWRRPKMAAEFFRARYAEEPFVSLFFAGAAGEKRLHLFTNCERIRLTRDDAAPTDLARALHHVVELDTEFTEIKAVGIRGKSTVVERLKMWGEAATIAIAIEGEHAVPGRTIAVDLTICDTEGTPVRDWNGHVTIAIEGAAELLTYSEACEVLMARGEGRAYLALGTRGGEVEITASAPDLRAGAASFPISSTGSSEKFDHPPDL